MEDCIFCKIVNDEIPSMKVFENDSCLAFLDINPECDGDTLIIPKEHYKDIEVIPTDVLIKVLDATKEVMKVLREKLHCDGFTLVQNNGDIQDIKHFHIHIRPYYNNKKTIEVVKYSDQISDPKEVYNNIKK